MDNKYLTIKGARAHNLKNIDLKIPRDKLVVFTGPSGSGKSSLAFDTIYAEGHRRFVESLSSYARMFIGQMDKPEIDSIDGLSPAISIDQKTTSRNPRSTVGTVTEIYDYLRLLYARTGTPHCPVCGKEIVARTVDSILDEILSMPEGTRFMVLAPVVRAKKGMHEKVFEDARKNGYVRARIDGILYELSDLPALDKNIKHSIDIVLDRLVLRGDIRSRLSDSVEAALRLADGLLTITTVSREGDSDSNYSLNFACEEHGISFPELSPRMFSFNNPFGACPECDGLGEKTAFSPEKIIPDPTLSLREGAIAVNGFKTIDENTYNGPLYMAVGNQYGFTLDTPICEYSDRAREVLLWGGPEKYAVTRHFEGIERSGIVRFEGIIPMIKMRYDMGHNEYYEQFIDSIPCPKCNGRRLKPEILAVTVGGKNIDEYCSMPVNQALEFTKNLVFDREKSVIAKDILKEVKARLGFLNSVGLDYLTLSRQSGTLSGGEAQRIRLATQIGSGLMGVLYILDEPSIGLHQRDNQKLIDTLKRLRDSGNSVIVVEHDEETMLASDYIVDIGPGAGVHGGNVVACGTPKQVMDNKNSVTADFLTGRRKIEVPAVRRPGNGQFLTVVGAKQNNLKDLTVKFPLGKLTCVTGVSGSGKSSLVNGILYPHLARVLNRAYTFPGKADAILGVENLDKVVCIDQSPIGRTPRSNPATYTGVFSEIRELFAKTPDAKRRAYTAGRFSFNVKGGRCEACEGDGVKKIEMHFLPDVYVTCDACRGMRYNRDTLEVRYKGKNIFEVLDMTVEESLAFFESIPSVRRKLETLYDVGLGYIKLGQSSTTLSGGEAQRVKLATELSRRSTGKTIYILDEPTTGLHSADVEKLITILHRLADGGNTVLVIEHNLDVIKVADHIIDLGPEGGDKGGTLVAQGTPEEVAQIQGSYTGAFLKKLLFKRDVEA
ncbi:MAG: excinuclease ABC subunit UvrA [Ruminococcaceae bacterium]|nr:excinuclease ABC subunit UvrA [Oscillospiraceae bacterium]